MGERGREGVGEAGREGGRKMEGEKRSFLRGERAARDSTTIYPYRSLGALSI